MLNEFYRVAFRKKIDRTLDDLQADLEYWLQEYNEQRSHQGRWCYGKTPLQTFMDSVPLTKGGVELVSVASRGEVRPGTVPSGIASPPQGTIRMVNSNIVTGDPSFANSQSGPIVIRGGQLVMNASTITGQVGPNVSPVFTLFGSGVTLQLTDSIRANDSHIVTHGGGTCGGPCQGTVSLEAGRAIRLTNSTVEADINFGDPGQHGGSVALSAPVVTLDGSHVSATGVVPPRPIAAPGGTVTIQADQVHLRNGSELTVVGRDLHADASSGGTIVVNATDTVRVDQSRINASGIPGEAGNISITAEEAVRFNHAELFAGTESGNVGNIVIEAGKTFVSESGAISAGSRDGNGGNIIIQAPERIRIDGGLITTRAGGDGAGGNISLNSDVVRLRDGARVESTAVNGPGGSVTINANDFRTLNSTVDVKSQFGPNGTVSIQPLP